MENPTRLASAIFRTKATVLQLQRKVWDIRHGIKPCPQNAKERFGEVIATSSSPLWTDERESEVWYQRGKIQNLRLAAARLHGTIIPAGATFSFWKSVGRATRARGFVKGRMLQQGCMIPAVGGGLCQLSNALYDAALLAGCEIVERHAHSQVVPGSASAIDRDATVAWNYIDLRFRSIYNLQLEVQLNASTLDVRLRGDAAPRAASGAALRVLPTSAPSPNSCDSCGRVQCFRHEKPRIHSKRRTAFLLDAAWPEFKQYIQSHHYHEDVAGVPLRGDRWRKGNYDWPVADFAKVRTATLSTLQFALKSRRLADQGSVRQNALLERSRHLATSLSRILTPDVDEVVVSQSLLPFLWMSGDLGGRRVRVLTTSLPIDNLQAALDAAALAHPESPTLADFRAPAWLRDYEAEALHEAEAIITPHCAVAALFSSKTTLLPWEMPASVAQRPAPMLTAERAMRVLYFPGPTLGRKGAYEVRDAALETGAKILLSGRQLEGPDFWRGVDTSPADGNWIDRVDAVVAPSIVESQPRRLLKAVAAGMPVLATANCGLGNMPGVRTVPALDSTALAAAIQQL